MKATVGIVLHVIGILEFIRVDIFVPDSELLGKSLGIALVGFGDGSGIGCYSNCLIPQYTMSGPSKISRIGSSGIGDNHLIHLAQQSEKQFLLCAGRIRIHNLGCGQIDQRGHKFNYTGMPCASSAASVGIPFSFQPINA